MGKLYAHSANVNGERQLLVDHLRNVANSKCSSYCGTCSLTSRSVPDSFELRGMWMDTEKRDIVQTNSRMVASQLQFGTGPLLRRCRDTRAGDSARAD